MLLSPSGTHPGFFPTFFAVSPQTSFSLSLDQPDSPSILVPAKQQYQSNISMGMTIDICGKTFIEIFGVGEFIAYRVSQ